LPGSSAWPPGPSSPATSEPGASAALPVSGGSPAVGTSALPVSGVSPPVGTSADAAAYPVIAVSPCWTLSGSAAEFSGALLSWPGTSVAAEDGADELCELVAAGVWAGG